MRIKAGLLAPKWPPIWPSNMSVAFQRRWISLHVYTFSVYGSASGGCVKAASPVLRPWRRSMLPTKGAPKESMGSAELKNGYSAGTTQTDNQTLLVASRSGVVYPLRSAQSCNQDCKQKKATVRPHEIPLCSVNIHYMSLVYSATMLAQHIMIIAGTQTCKLKVSGI